MRPSRAVDEAVAAAALRGATSASLSVQRTGTSVSVGFEDDGARTGEVPVHLADRVGAVGGSVAIDATSGTRILRATNPVRVIVAEDVMLTREGIVRLLADEGVDVVGATDDAGRLLDPRA